MARLEIGSLIDRITHSLREHAFSTPPGTFLGKECDLLARFAVSRPTFRQAAKIVEQEQLILIRVGVGGGYYSRRPDSDAVLHMTSIYLRANDTTLEHQVRTFAGLYMVSVRLAAAQVESEGWRDLDTFVEEEERLLNAQQDWIEYFQGQRRLVNLLAVLSGNPLIRLLLEITSEMTHYLCDRIVPLDPNRIMIARRTRLKVMKAIVYREPDVAEVLAKRWMDEVGVWLLPHGTHVPARHPPLLAVR